MSEEKGKRVCLICSSEMENDANTCPKCHTPVDLAADVNYYVGLAEYYTSARPPATETTKPKKSTDS